MGGNYRALANLSNDERQQYLTINDESIGHKDGGGAPLDNVIFYLTVLRGVFMLYASRSRVWMSRGSAVKKI